MTRYAYLGGPITGLTYEAAAGWRDPEGLYCRELRRRGWSPLIPMREEDWSQHDGPLPGVFQQGNTSVFQDLRDIDQSHVVIINTLGSEWASIGSMAEMGYAYALGKPIIVIRESGNIHDHIFVTNMAYEIVPSLDWSLHALDALVRKFREPQYA